MYTSSFISDKSPYTQKVSKTVVNEKAKS